MAYLSPEQLTGQVLLNMHVDDNDQIVTTSNTKFNLIIYFEDAVTEDGGKIYSKYAGKTYICYNDADLTQLMRSVHDFTISFWHPLKQSYGTYSFFDDWIQFKNENLYEGYNYSHCITVANNDKQLVNIPAPKEKDKWMHIAAVSNNGTLSIYADGVRQTSKTTPYYNKNTARILFDINGFYADDTCIILNQALWTNNFTPPDGPLLGDLKYKTVLYPKFQRLYQNEDQTLLKLY